MKNTHVCPKCGGTNIIVPARSFISPRSAQDGVTQYRCADCGYVELWADENLKDNAPRNGEKSL